MEILKVQFEIRYKVILGFESEIPTILAPLQKIGGELLLNELQEGRYVLLFRSDSYLIDIRNDRMIFMSNNNLNLFIGINGSFNHFINTFNKILALPGFVKITYKVLAKWFLQSNSENLEENNTYFKNKYLNFHNEFLSNVDDTSFILESTSKSGITSRITVGPFNSKKDIDNHNLRTPFDSPNKYDLLNGFLINSIVSDTENLFNIDIVRNLDSLSNKFEKLKV